MFWPPYSSNTSHHPSQTPCLPWISYATQNSCSIHARCSKSSLKHSIRFYGFFPSLKQNFISYRSSKVSSRPDCIFEIHLLWQSSFTWVYSNSCSSCWFEPEIIKIGLSSYKKYSNNILNIQESTTILNTCKKKSGYLLKAPRLYIYIYSQSTSLYWNILSLFTNSAVNIDTSITQQNTNYIFIYYICIYICTRVLHFSQMINFCRYAFSTLFLPYALFCHYLSIWRKKEKIKEKRIYTYRHACIGT